eukprot:1581782-Pyramimonas_sp.AAC.1
MDHVGHQRLRLVLPREQELHGGGQGVLLLWRGAAASRHWTPQLPLMVPYPLGAAEAGGGGGGICVDAAGGAIGAA